MSDVNKTRVLFLINGLRVGGAEKLLVEIINRIDPAKIKPTIVSIDANIPLAASLSPGRTGLHVFSRRWRYDLSPALKIRGLVVENEIDAIVSFAMFDYFFARIATLGQRRPPQIYIYIHSTVPPTRKWYLQDWIYSRLLGKTERFISVCNAQADYWVKTYAIPREKFTTVYGGVDVNYFCAPLSSSAHRDIRREYHIPENAKVILLVASLAKYKRHEDAIHALKVASGLCDDEIFLLCVGPGTIERQSKLRVMARALGVADKMIFCGAQGDVRPFLLAGDVFTLTSSSVETFSIAALEAMAMGLPCVLTDIGGAREMIVEGKNGFLVTPRDPKSIAEGWLQALNRKGGFDKTQIRQRVADKFSIQKMVADLERLLLSRNTVE